MAARKVSPDITKENTDLSGTICDTVMVALRRITQSLDLHSRYLMREFGLTGPQLVILQKLSKFEEISVGELSKSISLSQATVTGILERLEKRGLIERSRSSVDRRRVMVKSTAECATLLDRAPPLMGKSFTGAFTDLQEWEQMMILSSLQRLVDLMEADQFNGTSFYETDMLEEMDGKE
ncbi:MAG: MarR family winged helix-turn-helix transcriptional regulator [Thermodesulfobacteriota bacterium]